jgi:hypothetical protein
LRRHRAARIDELRQQRRKEYDSFGIRWLEENPIGYTLVLLYAPARENLQAEFLLARIALHQFAEQLSNLTLRS